MLQHQQNKCKRKKKEKGIRFWDHILLLSRRTDQLVQVLTWEQLSSLYKELKAHTDMQIQEDKGLLDVTTTVLLPLYQNVRRFFS